MPRPTTPEIRVSERFAAQLRGLGWALSSLALLWPLTAGIVALSHHQRAQGISLIALAVGGRLIISRVIASSNATVAARHRAAQRENIVTLLATSHDEGVVSLLAAVDDAASFTIFETLRTAAGASSLSLPAIYFVGGWLPLGLVVGLVGLAVPFYIRAGRRTAIAEATFRDHRAQLGHYQLDLLQHGSELRALGAVPFGAATIAALSTREHDGALRAIREALGSSLVTEFLGGVSIGLVAMVEGFGLLHGTKQLGPAVLSTLLTAEFIGWVRRYGVAFHQRERTSDALAQLAAARRPLAHPATPEIVLTCTDLVPLHGATPVTVTLRTGEHLSVTGPSGSGKSTLLATWLGWRRAHSGESTLTSLPVGVVTVASSLGDGTVRDELSLGRLWTDEHLQASLRDVGLNLDLDRRLSPDGVGLSSGERVRVLIARALLHDVALLVLDDITGLLDEDNRQRVTQALALRPTLSVVEATVDEPALITPTHRVDLS